MCEENILHEGKTARASRLVGWSRGHGLIRAIGQGLGLFLLLMPLSGNPGRAQNPVYLDSGQLQGAPGLRLGNRGSLDDYSRDSLQDEKRLRALNMARQKSMVSDSDKLLRLATELNSEIAAGNGGALNLEQLRKVAEIEKLAHNVKEKMSTSVRGVQVYPAGSPLQYP
jgi:hypothetical protein